MQLPLPEVFRTDTVPEAQRLGYWNDVAQATFGDIAVDAARLNAHLTRRQVGSLKLARVRSSPVVVEGGRHDPVRTNASHWFVLLNRRGACRVRQRGREAVLDAGDIALLDADERYRISVPHEHEMLVLQLGALPARTDLERHAARRYRSDQAPLIAAFVLHIDGLQRDGLPSPDDGLFAQVAADLVALTWPDSRAQPGRQSAAAWRQRLEQLVERRLGDPALNAVLLAQELQISPRYVQALFAGMGSSAAAYILERRLLRAAALLQQTPVRITDLAMNLGFNDVSSFCHAFAKRYGLSASRYRKQA